MKKYCKTIAYSVMCAIISFSSVFSSTVYATEDEMNTSFCDSTDYSNEFNTIEEDDNEIVVEEEPEEEEPAEEETLFIESIEDDATEDISGNDSDDEAILTSDEELGEFLALSGAAGENATWTFDSKTGKLIISGKGELYSYTRKGDRAPYSAYKGQVASIVVKKGITSLGDFCLAGLGNVESVTLEDGLKTIGQGAFDDTHFWKITIPKTVTKIDLSSFRNTYVSEIVFKGNAPEFTIPEDNLEYYNYALYFLYFHYPYKNKTWNKDVAEKINALYTGSMQENRYVGIYFVADGKKLSAKCGDNVTWELVKVGGMYDLKIKGSGKMYDYTFFNTAPWFQKNGYIRNIEISPDITHIGDFALFGGGQGGHGTLELSAKLKTIGDYAFYYSRYKDVVADEKTKLQSIGDFGLYLNPAGYGVGKATKFPNSVIQDTQRIGKYAFCPDLIQFEDLNLNAAYIGERAFCNCTGPTSITLGKNVETVGAYAFGWCENVKNIDFGNVKNVGKGAFYKCGVHEELTIPDSMIVKDSTSESCLPEVTKKLTLGKNFTYFGGIYHDSKNNLEIHCTGDFMPDISKYTNMPYTIYYPADNTTWIIGINKFNKSVIKFIPEGEASTSGFRVKFITNCEQKAEDQIIDAGGRIRLPELKNKGKCLEDWYLDSDFTEHFNPVYRVGSDMTLYAKWVDGWYVPGWGDITWEDRYSKGFKKPEDVRNEVWFCTAYHEAVPYSMGPDIFCPTFHVYRYKTSLKEGRDYSVSFDVDRKNGTATALINVKGQDPQTLKYNLEVWPLDINDAGLFGDKYGVFNTEYNPCIFADYNEGNSWNGKPEVTLLKDGNTIVLKENEDYIVEYSSSDFRTKGKKHALKVKGIGFYKDSRDYYVILTDKDQNQKVKVEKIADQKYAGKRIEPHDLIVKYDKKVLEEGKDYELSYANNYYVGKAYVNIRGIGEYSFGKTVEFNIVGEPISNLVLKDFMEKVTYRPGGVTQEKMRLYDENQKILSSFYYSVTYKNNDKPGTATMIIKGQYKYSGTIKKTFKIKGIDVNKLTFKGTSREYRGRESEDLNYISFDVNAYHKGKKVNGFAVYATTQPQENVGSFKVWTNFDQGVFGEKQIKLKVTPFKVTKDRYSVIYADELVSSKIGIVYEKSYSLTDVAVKAKPFIYFQQINGRYTLLQEGRDYTITYKNNKKVGKATATIKFKGNFKGSVKTKFEIVK